MSENKLRLYFIYWKHDGISEQTMIEAWSEKDMWLQFYEIIIPDKFPNLVRENIEITKVQ